MRTRSWTCIAAWGCALGLWACDPGSKDDAVDAGKDAGPDVETPAGGGSGPGGSPGGTSSGGSQSMEPAPDGGGDAGREPFRLDGEWEDNGRRLMVEVDSEGTVAGIYVEEVVCDLETGSVPPGTEPDPGANVVTTMFDFFGMLDHAGPEVVLGDIISSDASVDPGGLGNGGLNTCRYGFDAASGVQNGFVLAPFWLEVIDRNTLSGEWQADADADGTLDETRPFEVTRL